MTWPDLQALGFTMLGNMRLVSHMLGFWVALLDTGSKSGHLPQQLCATLLELAGELSESVI